MTVTLPMALPSRRTTEPPGKARARLRAGLALAAAVVSLRVTAQVSEAPGSPAPAAAPVEAAPWIWSLHEQATWIDQWHYDFPSPYSGPQSFQSGYDDERTFSFTLYLGVRLWEGAQVYYNPEMLQGHGLSQTLGIAGFPNGEAVKAAFYNLHYSTSRLFLRQTFNLGGEKQKVDDDQNQVAVTRDANYLVVSVGKFSANDFFDDNAYSHDPRIAFLNWSLWESAAWDYPADVIGYTGGAVVELTEGPWTYRYGLFMEPTVSNGPTLQTDIGKEDGQILQVDRAYGDKDHGGTLRAFVFWNHADMGSYADSIALSPADPDIAKTRAPRSKEGFGVSWDQQLTADLGAFVRLSWNDGKTETWAFSEVDRSGAGGLSLKGGRWGRPDDVLGLAGVVNALSSEHAQYLADGGLGLNLGDGRLNYGYEEILETYYNVKVWRGISVAPDFQYVEHPGYNRDRGGVALYAVRIHEEF